ncbi:hypothetical protein ENSA5_10650 [Enhygromyxa salina]|uniref:Uncharacterized protein n=1 Tax=Enhygromyxa salina TaxID=215803 RepID=A0A2S9YGG8_9BACT|nr:hypothetical protein ENSA5_10650 [Enhygromyxa salina]
MFAATRASFELLFGVELQLQGIVIWDVAPGAEVDALLADLTTRERDGADVIIGLVAQAQPPKFEATSWTGDKNGDYALVFADLAQRDRYYRNLLRALAGLLGAEPTTDAASKQLGSFMSDATPPAGSAPVLDPENRGKVIINKRRPMAQADPGPTPDDGSNPDVEEN